VESEDDKLFAMDRTAFSVGSINEESDEKAYWQTKSPRERMMVVEYLRQVAYGYDPVTARLQRYVEFAKL
jgi:hypothetical protein